MSVKNAVNTQPKERLEGVSFLIWATFRSGSRNQRGANLHSSTHDAARGRCLLPSSLDPISDPFPRRLFDPAVSEIGHGDDHRQVHRVGDIAMPQPGSQEVRVVAVDHAMRK